MCSRTVLNELKNLQSLTEKTFRSDFVGALYNVFCKACRIILFVVTMLVLLNENISCR